MKKLLKNLVWMYYLIIPSIILLYSCNPKTTSEEEIVLEEDTIEVDEDLWVVEEFEINDLPVTSQSPKAAEKPLPKSNAAPAVTPSPQANAAEVDDEDYDIATLDYLTDLVAEQEYEAETTMDVTTAIVPLEETQTLVSFNKKGKNAKAFQVVSDGSTGEIEQIIFTDKKHTDEYDVTTGMKGSDVKKLRRELKHMTHKGKVYLYNDDSNVMYLMDAENMAGEEVTAADVENMNVSAIIWKDKKHHKHK
ncbi:hypothetical protein DFQ04_1112 [Algoriphagus boseongensis]|uniref:Uncharacterized protein n=1 Tax=Algoriphagus boseongensis TaxID=1442587 RepID=A0A4R6T970_9BACT|nr:hypothetical protein [Algoriphagus boseongensis]TDQ19291.1 hypothetical protein DFQ04_1112 [Algoriphagus boseongensis]